MAKKEGKGKSIATAIIYPLITILIALSAYNSGGVTDQALWASVACSVLAAIVTLASGFYLLIIPLPIIYFYSYGTVKQRGWFATFLLFLLVFGLLTLSVVCIFGGIL